MVELALPKNSRPTVGKTWPRPANASNVREFRVTFAVDLEKRWALPPIADDAFAVHGSKETAGGEP